MKELELIAEYETSFGKILLVKSCETLKVGENILVKDKIYKIKRIIFCMNTSMYKKGEFNSPFNAWQRVIQYPADLQKE